tara:strand:+ start:332 stop:574 length:243 start_codon:yes stop_codon:yes gene_type:complete
LAILVQWSYYVGSKEARSQSEIVMKKLFAGVLVALSMTGLVFACGGMTQIDPPSLQLDAGQADLDLKSVVEDIEGVVCLA